MSLLYSKQMSAQVAAISGNEVISSTNLDDLIVMLQSIRAKNGNTPVVYYDQGQWARFLDPYCVYNVDRGILYFGGFHENGITFGNLQ